MFVITTTSSSRAFALLQQYLVYNSLDLVSNWLRMVSRTCWEAHSPELEEDSL